MAIFAEGVTTNGKGLIPFKRGAFNNNNPVKLIHLKYKSNGYHLNLNMASIFDSFILLLLQFKTSLTCYELEGCFYPKEFTTWQEYAEETRKFMADEFNLQIYPGNFKDKLQMEKECSPLLFES